MIALIVLIMVAIFVGRIAGSALRLTGRSHWHYRRQMERRGEPVPELPPQPVETPLEALQRRFARGDLSMEQYERELNRLYGIHN